MSRPTSITHQIAAKGPGSAERGFTLVEVIMAATILVVGFIGLINALTIGTQMLDTAKKQQIAMRILDGEVEWLRSGSVTAISGMTNSTTYTLTVNDDGTSATGDTTRFYLDNNTALRALAKGFTCAVVKTNVRTNYRKLIYTVTWIGNTGRSYSRTREVYFGLNGLQLSYQQS